MRGVRVLTEVVSECVGVADVRDRLALVVGADSERLVLTGRLVRPELAALDRRWRDDPLTQQPGEVRSFA